MAYNQNIPQPTDLPSTSQGDILGNFQAIYSLIGINHSNFGTANVGKHNFVSLPVQTADPGTTGTELALYTKTSTLSGNPEAFFQRQANGAAIEFTSAIQATPGWTRLPSNILLKWGQLTTTGSVTSTLPTGGTIPPFANVFTAYVIPFSNGAVTDPNVSVTLTGLTNTFPNTTIATWAGQRTTSAAATVTYTYLIIGN